MSRRARSFLPLAGLLVSEVLAVVVLHRLGGVEGLGGPGTDPIGWLRTASPEEAVAGALRVVALGAAWWLLATTLLSALAAVAEVPALMRAAGVVALPGIRRCVDRALAATFVASAVFTAPGSIAAADEPPSTVEVRDGRAIETAPVPVPAPPAPDPPPVPAEPAPASHAVHVVVPGDSLWTIAVRQVANDADVLPYWTRLVDANRHTLRSGNPNLIYPGEVVELPIT